MLNPSCRRPFETNLRPFTLTEILDPDLLNKILVSPRIRAQQTFELLFAPEAGNPKINDIRSTYEGVREWTYGNFEGALVDDVNKERRAVGQPDWDIVSHPQVSVRAFFMVQRNSRMLKHFLAVDARL